MHGSRLIRGAIKRSRPLPSSLPAYPPRPSTSTNCKTANNNKCLSIRNYHQNRKDANPPPTPTTMRLSKRMAHLDLCSRREADRLISLGLVLVRGEKIEPVLGQKISADETDISIVDDIGEGATSTIGRSEEDGDNVVADPLKWERIRGDTIVLHKPMGYVSGQPDRRHGHIPAVRLLTRSNLYLGDDNDGRYDEARETLKSGMYFNFGRIFMDNRDFPPSAPLSPEEEEGANHQKRGGQRRPNRRHPSVSTLLNYAPAGRLDLDSSGLLIFTRNGVIAKRLLSQQTKKLVHREYLVRVEPVQSLSRIEISKGMRSLPYPPRWDLSSLTRPITKGGSFRGNRLWDDDRPLRPLVDAAWVDGVEDGGEGGWNGRGTLRLVLQEGRKRQIRRMCRELLGLHVVDLVRVRVGSVALDDLPEGMWRPLRRGEVEDFLG